MTTPARPRIVATAAAVLGVLALAVLTPVASLAADTATPASAQGAEGQKLTATPTSDLPAGGSRLTVAGSGYSTFKGIYVAVCKIPAKGALPTPCGGGIDTTGATETSKWISSNPPTYGKGLAEPYGKGGTFDVTLWAAPTLPNGEDCRKVGCAVITRADHTRTSDRSQDVLIPVTFAADASDAEDGPNLLLVGGGGVLLVVVAGLAGYKLARPRKRADADMDASATPTTDEA